jgi:hypothetical protein
MSPICGELKLKHDFVRNCTEACSFGAGKALGSLCFILHHRMRLKMTAC